MDFTVCDFKQGGLRGNPRPGFVVRASNCYPILDFAFSTTEWINAEVGQSTVKISLSAFVTLMVDLRCADVFGNTFSLIDQNLRISLAMVRNSDVSTYTFDRRMAEMYGALDVGRVELIFNRVVTVTFFNTRQWSPSQILQDRANAAGDLLSLYTIPDRETENEPAEVDPFL